MKPIPLIALLVLLCRTAAACLNLNDVNLEGKTGYSDQLSSYGPANLERHFGRQHWQALADKLMAKAKAKKPGVFEMSDFAVVLVHLGQYKDALQILQVAEDLKPGRSSIASNLGTVYELLGDNQRARVWIAIGIKRNPKDHDGTEWVHLRILDAKLALAKDPNWLRTNRVLGPEHDHGTAAEPKPAREGGTPLADALGYQLQERLEFVKAPEPIVGELLFALGDEVALQGGVSIALELYEFAATFGPERASLLQLRTEHARALLKAAGPEVREAKTKAPSHQAASPMNVDEKP